MTIKLQEQTIKIVTTVKTQLKLPDWRGNSQYKKTKGLTDHNPRLSTTSGKL